MEQAACYLFCKIALRLDRHRYESGFVLAAASGCNAGCE
jgi:hypothetical protein